MPRKTPPTLSGAPVGASPTQAAASRELRALPPLPERDSPKDWPADPQTGETALARAAYEHFRDLLPHERTLQTVCDNLALARSTVEGFSACWDWQARVRDHDAQMDAIRMKAKQEAIARDAADAAARLKDAGEKLLAAAMAVLGSYVDPATGQLKQQAPLRDVAPLVKQATEALGAAAEKASESVTAMSPDEWKDALMAASPEQRVEMIKALKIVKNVRKAG